MAADSDSPAAPWRPVRGLASSAVSLRLRRDVARLADAIHAESPPGRVDRRAVAPTFFVERDEWSAYKEEPWMATSEHDHVHAIVRMPAELLRRDDEENGPEDGGLRVCVRFRSGRDGAFERRYIEQVDGELLCYESQRAQARVSIELLSVVVMTPLAWELTEQCGPYGIELVTRDHTWEIVLDTERQYRRTLGMLCGYVDPPAVAPDFRDFLETADTTTEASVVIRPSTTVGQVVVQAFKNFKKTAAAPLLPFRAGNYVLKIPGRRDFLLIPTRPLHEHLHVNEFWHRVMALTANGTFLRLMLVHHSQVLEAVAQNETPAWDRLIVAEDVENDAVDVAPHAVDLSASSLMVTDGTDAASQPSTSPDHAPTSHSQETSPTAPLDDGSLRELRGKITVHPLVPLNAAEERQLWTHRELFEDLPEALSRVLLCVDWTDQVQVDEALRLLPKWTKPSHPAAWIEFLRPEFRHETVRAFAVEKIDEMPDATLVLILPQLVQALKFEPSYSSPLTLLLVKRALISPMRVGFELFWLLKVETYEPQHRDRYGTVLNAYFDASSVGARRIFKTQDELFADGGVFQRVWEVVHENASSSHEEMNRILADELSQLTDKLPTVFQLPIDPRFDVCGLFIAKCRVLDEPNFPLLLVFKNADKQGGEPVGIIFDVGDNLRQERFSSQLIRFMEAMWRHDGLRLAVEPTRCVATSTRSVVVEVARDAVSIAEVHKRPGVMSTTEIHWAPHVATWIYTYCSSTTASRDASQDRFCQSSAGWAVAAAVLGIGDRDERNTMVTTNGRFFYSRLHKTLISSSNRGGDKPSQLPFTVAEEVHQTLGKSRFPRFVELSEDAFNTIRRNMHVWVSLLLLTVGAGQSSREAAQRFVETLRPELTEAEARDVVAVSMYNSVSLHFERVEKDTGLEAHAERRLHWSRAKSKPKIEDSDGFLAAFDRVGVWNEDALRGSRVNSSDLKVLRLLSSGGYGEVLVGSLDMKGSAKLVAIKRLAVDAQTKANAITVGNEILRMTKLHHPNLVAFVGVEWTKEWGAQVLTEFMPHGDLRTVLDAEQQKQDSAWLAWTEWKCQLAIDVVDALVYLEDNSSYWSMQTLKARNVLLETEIDSSDEGYVGGAKLSLYAAVRSRRPEEMHESSLRWLAPELAKASPLSYNSPTIYSFGVFLTELDTLKRPYYDAVNPDGSPMSTFKVQQLVSQGVLRPTLSEDCPEAIAAVIQQCLLQYPIQRPSAKQLAYKLRGIRKNEL